MSVREDSAEQWSWAEEHRLMADFVLNGMPVQSRIDLLESELPLVVKI